MTISYEEEFSSSMLRWRGSIWKAVLKDLIGFYIAYYVILYVQWGLMDEKQKEYFTGWIKWCEIGTQYIPLSFLLGFFVAVVVARWWEQFNWISWPDKLMMTVSTCLPGKENLEVRKTIARWSSLQSAIAWTGISVRTLKRFPTERHLVESKLMTEEEYDLYMSVNAPHGKWFVPLLWILNLLKQQLRERRIDTIQMQMLVVAIATYGYFFICLIGRQPKLDSKSMEQEITILFPIFTTFQMLFYIGWLKVGQFLMNPFGEDDDDFELNYVLDRNTYIAYMMASELADQLPSKITDEMTDIIPKGSLADFQITAKEMQLIRTDELEGAMKELEEREKRSRKINNQQRMAGYMSSPSLASSNIRPVRRSQVISAKDAEPPGACANLLVCFAVFLLILTFPISIFFCIKIVNQYERAVIFRLGRLRKGGAKGPGLFLVIPCIDEYQKVDLRLVSYSVPPQELLSKDSVTASVDAVIYFRISDATISVVNVENAEASTRLLAMTTLRNILGTKTLSEMLSYRDHISQEMQRSLDEATNDWGVQAEAEATREAKAKIIAAEGEQKASSALRAAALAISDTPTALQLRYLQTLGEISADNNSTIVFPFPVDFMSVFGKQSVQKSSESTVKQKTKESEKEKTKEETTKEDKSEKDKNIEQEKSKAVEQYFKKSSPREKKEKPKKKQSSTGKKK
uniref:Bestrophin homolog n=2 Tax=Meloidogyne javanica TaxID=6303 RepID=A0A915LXH5_MELJA